MYQNIHPSINEKTMCKVKSNQPSALYVNPMTDFGFKKIFGDELVMTAFLTDLLKPKSPIISVTFLDKDMQPDNNLERGVIYDLRCKTEDGGEFIVEMQNRGQVHFADRIIYYLSRSIAPQGDKGIVEIETDNGETKSVTWDFELEPIIGVFFLNFHLKGFEPRLLRTVKFKVEESDEIFTDKMQAYTIELPCLKKTESECTEDLEYWTYILNHMETFQSGLPFTGKKPIFNRVGELASLASMPTAERENYQRSLDQYRSIAATYVYERQQGREEGIAIGEERGIAKERELQTKKQEEERISNIHNMRSMGIEDSMIAKFLQLPLDYVLQH